MRLALTGLITAAALAAAAQSSTAQVAFFNERFCAGGGDASIPDCSFYTWEQCIASAKRGPLVHLESMVARASTAADEARQGPSAPLGRTMAESGPGIATAGGIVL